MSENVKEKPATAKNSSDGNGSSDFLLDSSPNIAQEKFVQIEESETKIVAETPKRNKDLRALIRIDRRCFR